VGTRVYGSSYLGVRSRRIVVQGQHGKLAQDYLKNKLKRSGGHGSSGKGLNSNSVYKTKKIPNNATRWVWLWQDTSLPSAAVCPLIKWASDFYPLGLLWGLNEKTTHQVLVQGWTFIQSSIHPAAAECQSWAYPLSTQRLYTEAEVHSCGACAGRSQAWCVTSFISIAWSVSSWGRPSLHAYLGLCSRKDTISWKQKVGQHFTWFPC
jgi:hypothetical protein